PEGCFEVLSEMGKYAEKAPKILSDSSGDGSYSERNTSRMENHRIKFFGSLSLPNRSNIWTMKSHDLWRFRRSAPTFGSVTSWWNRLKMERRVSATCLGKSSPMAHTFWIMSWPKWAGNAFMEQMVVRARAEGRMPALWSTLNMAPKKVTRSLTVRRDSR